MIGFAPEQPFLQAKSTDLLAERVVSSCLNLLLLVAQSLADLHTACRLPIYPGLQDFASGANPFGLVTPPILPNCSAFAHLFAQPLPLCLSLTR
jgi:hypothetical protein